MLEGLLSKAECAACRLCCKFDSYDLWDTPLVTDGIMLRALELDPAQRFSEASGRRLHSRDVPTPTPSKPPWA